MAKTRPVAIFRFSRTEGPAYFAEWLEARGIEWQLVALDEGTPVPVDPRAFAGIAMMGGPMSVNDALPWKAPLSSLLRAAVDSEVPVIGHCLGGQLLAQALCRGTADVDVEPADLPDGGGSAAERERSNSESRRCDCQRSAGDHRLMVRATGQKESYSRS